MGNIDTTQVMKSTVEYARNRAKEAESDFDRANSEIQRKASRTIDLFGGSAASSVVDIAHDARIACDNLFATYQSLIITVDEECRPLLAQNPDVTAVCEVKDLIRWLNEESEIENNFTASFNGRDLGDVASRRYIPSIESKMIERYWEDKYMTFPGRAEAEAKAQAERNEKLRIEREAREKEEAEKRAEYDRKMQAYEEECKKWKAISKNQQGLYEKELSAVIFQEKAVLEEKFDKAYSDKKHKLYEKRKNAEQALNDAQEKLANAGFFAFSAKKEAKAQVAESRQAIADVEKSLETAEKEYANKEKKVQMLLGKRKKELEKKIKEKYPVPPKPQKPQNLTMSSAVYETNWALKEAILASMKPGELYTIAEIIQNCPEACDLTNQRVSVIVRQLIPSHIERVEGKDLARFRLATSQCLKPQSLTTRSADCVTDGELKDIILASMEPQKLYTITDLVNNCSEISDLSNRRVASVVRQLVPSPIERIERNRKAYFRLAKQSAKQKPAVTSDAVRIANEMLREAILASMEIGKLYTIAEIIQNCPEAYDLTNQRVAALVRQMIPSHIERIEKERMAYFRRVK